MIFTPVLGSEGIALEGAFVLDLQKHEDDRGFFARAWCQNEFEDHGLSPRWVQANLAYSKNKGTLRGLHYQAAPYGEDKLMRCIRGAIYDVILDLRPESPTYSHWSGFELSSANHRALYVPQGFAHGYLTLVDDSEVFYPVSQFYTPGAERGIRWNDPAFAIDWPIRGHASDGRGESAGHYIAVGELILSDKDRNWPDYAC
jgi:dTDP-4-dehydrorhamnose 3,5-epimerase